jgi:alpha-glucosidase
MQEVRSLNARRFSIPPAAPSVSLLAVATAALLLPGLMTLPAHAAPKAAARAELALDRVTASKALDNGMELHSGSAVMQITALRDDVLRVRVGPEGTLPEDASWAVLPEARTAKVTVTAANSGNAVGFKTAKLMVSVDRATMALKVTDVDGHVIDQDEAGRPVEYYDGEGGRGFRVTKASPPEEHYFALGDKPGPLDRRNEAFTMWNTDSFGFQESTDPIYKSIPFVLTMNEGRAAGLFLDNTWRTNWEFNKVQRDAWSFTAPGGPLDYYLLYGPEPKQVLSSWAWLVGHTPLPPKWSLGYQQSRYSYYPESEVCNIAKHLRADHIPADVIWLDIDYQQNNRPFTVDRERFPHFEQMVKDLAAENFNTVAIVDLHVAKVPNAGYKPYDTGVAGDHFVKNPDGSTFVGTVWPGPSVFPDFTQASTRDWWGTLFSDFMKDGVAGFWNDMNEPSVFNVPSKTMPDDVQHRIDEPGFRKRTANHLEIHNVYGMENIRATHDGMAKLEPNMRPFVMTRASYAGGQRYAATWTGDNSSTWNHLRMTTPMIENLGLSGFAMVGADVGGFAGTPQADLLTKWLEIGAFQPIDRDHTAKGTAYQEPWVSGVAQENIRRRFIEERYRLMPYLYTTTEEMTRTGVPILRPLFVEFPDATPDKHPMDVDTPNEFLFGPDILVAPAPYPDELDDYFVQLPPVTWYDYWTGAKLPPLPKMSSRDLEQPAAKEEMARLMAPFHVTPSVDVLPVYVREGAILPIQPLTQSTKETPKGPLTLRVYLPNTAAGALPNTAAGASPQRDATDGGPQPCVGSVYLDDGVTLDYQKGAFLREQFSCTVSGDTVTVKAAPREGSFAAWWSALHIEVYGGPSTKAEGSDGTLATYNAQRRAMLATIPDSGKGAELTLKYAEPAAQ